MAKKEEIKIEEIKPYPKNAKKHPQKQIRQIADSIKEFGFNQPIVLDKKKVIIVGHGRFEAAKMLKLKVVPCITVNLSSKKAKAYRLADNKLNESDWEMELVIEELKELDEDILELTGFDKDLIAEIEEDEFDAEEEYKKIKKPKAKLGDIYQLGEHRLMCGDSAKAEDVEKLMEDKKICDWISIRLVRIAQNGNMLAREKLISLLGQSVSQWVEIDKSLSSWSGYNDLMAKEIEGCISRFRYAGSFIGYLYRTLEYSGRGLTPLEKFSLDDFSPITQRRRIETFYKQ